MKDGESCAQRAPRSLPPSKQPAQAEESKAAPGGELVGEPVELLPRQLGILVDCDKAVLPWCPTGMFADHRQDAAISYLWWRRGAVGHLFDLCPLIGRLLVSLRRFPRTPFPVDDIV